jgi:hypothetical protein
VLRDDTELGRVSLGTPLPLDPGAHVIVARGGGLERKYDVTLAEREVKTIDVTPVGGAKTATPVGVVAAGATAPAATPLAPAKVDPPAPTDTPPTAAPTPAAATTSSLAKDESPDVTNTSSRGSTQRTVAIVAGSVGVAGLAAGVVMGLVAKNSQNEAAARCPGGSCTDPSDVEQASSAQNLGNIATGVFIAGAASLVAGGVLWFTAPSPGKVGLFVTPTVGVSSGGIALFGRY